MLNTNVQDLGLTATAASGCCGSSSTESSTVAAPAAAATGGCCGSKSKQSASVDTLSVGAFTETFDVDGMTCSGCVTRVSKAVGDIAGAQSVSIDLVSGGVSKMTVSSAMSLDRADVAAAVATTGYKLV